MKVDVFQRISLNDHSTKSAKGKLELTVLAVIQCPLDPFLTIKKVFSAFHCRHFRNHRKSATVGDLHILQEVGTIPLSGQIFRAYFRWTVCFRIFFDLFLFSFIYFYPFRSYRKTVRLWLRRKKIKYPQSLAYNHPRCFVFEGGHMQNYASIISSFSSKGIEILSQYSASFIASISPIKILHELFSD